MNMHSTLRTAVLAAACAAALDAHAGNATADEAVAMVKKGIAAIKADGRDKAYAEIGNKQGRFIDRDLYLVVLGFDGVSRAHGANEKLVGKNILELKDIDGKPFVREMLQQAQVKPSFWQEYKFTNPVSKKIEPKALYCERLDDSVVCGGIYR